MANFIKKILLLLILFFFMLFGYVSLVGIKTDNFNNLIKEEIKNKNKDISIQFEDIFVKLDLSSYSIKLQIDEPLIVFKDRNFQIRKISSNTSITSFFKKENYINSISIITNKNEIKDLIKFYRLFNDNLQLLLLEKIINKGEITSNIKVNIDKNGKIKDNYLIEGNIENFELNLLNGYFARDLNFNFKIEKNNQLVENLKFKIDNNKFISEEILFQSKKDEFLVKGNILSSATKFDKNIINTFFGNFNYNFDIDKFVFESKTEFDLKSKKKPLINSKLNKNFKFDDVNISSTLLINDFLYTSKIKNFNKYIVNSNENIFFKDQKIKIDYKNDKLIINNNGKFSFDKKNFDEINVDLIINNNILNFNINTNINNHNFAIPILNYKKRDNVNVNINGIYKKNNFLKINELKLLENENIFKFKNVSINKNNKIKSFEKINFIYKDLDGYNNDLLIYKKKQNYFLESSSFNGKKLIDDFLFSSSDNNVFKNFDNLTSKLNVKINKFLVENTDFINDISGFIKLKKNKIINASIKGVSNSANKTFLSIETKNTTSKLIFFTENPNPFVSKYSFIKGFDGNFLELNSSNTNNKSKSKLVINDFKLKETPALTKILSLASLQGIADLLTGEGIRFNEFDMTYTSENGLITIDEMYAIGPAISILMSGYIDGDKLVSLRGTLVPATTINKAIGSIPLLGNILIGKKTGEGVFGVSFKLKGPPNDIKTTVNPIKTLTPRFITRTLEKIKKN